MKIPRGASGENARKLLYIPPLALGVAAYAWFVARISTRNSTANDFARFDFCAGTGIGVRRRQPDFNAHFAQNRTKNWGNL
jgi:hypothetical protein